MTYICRFYFTLNWHQLNFYHHSRHYDLSQESFFFTPKTYTYLKYYGTDSNTLIFWTNWNLHNSVYHGTILNFKHYDWNTAYKHNPIFLKTNSPHPYYIKLWSKSEKFFFFFLLFSYVFMTPKYPSILTPHPHPPLQTHTCEIAWVPAGAASVSPTGGFSSDRDRMRAAIELFRAYTWWWPNRI